MKFILFLLFIVFSFYTYAGHKCDKLTLKINSIMSSLNSCEVDSDCVIEPIHVCPFGCYVFKNKNIDTTKLHEHLSHYAKSCQPCVYRCARPPEKLVCRDKVCTVE